jgi:hypothetical protein
MPDSLSNNIGFPAEVEAVVDDIKSMLIEKNKAYGDAALSPRRIFSRSDSVEQIKVRIDDKLSRISNDAPGEDSTMDLLGYLILLRIAERRARSARSRLKAEVARIRAGWEGERDSYTDAARESLPSGPTGSAELRGDEFDGHNPLAD